MISNSEVCKRNIGRVSLPDDSAAAAIPLLICKFTNVTIYFKELTAIFT